MAEKHIRAAGSPAFSPARRNVLRAGVAVSSLFVPMPYAWVWAQSEGALKLLRLPKLALVVGNSKYKESPLKNPANDARAIGDTLRQHGFEVTVKLDAGRADLSAAIQAYVQELARRKGVGLFYFAGHGLQLAWRNYMLPVDADIDVVADIPKQSVELGGMLEAIGKAANPMNVIILDACRDNPFGSLKGVDHKGLSQMDAPISTFLAYATSPGNTASDGDGVNGLYTENLLKEIRVPAAKIEDVFKRVRLQVRRRTHGQQIPWESTSLEDDFYFLPPGAAAPPADHAAELKRAQEQALRDKQRIEEEARLKQEQALREAKLAQEEAERKRQQELALLEKQRIAEEAERKKRQELALREAQRVAEAAERKRREEQALREARLAQEEAERKYQQELALSEKQRAEDEAARKRKEKQALREAKLAQEEAERKYQQELALREKQRAQAEAERQSQPAPAQAKKPDPAEEERLFREELAIWEKIHASADAAPLMDYLLRYPSGRYAELAQFQLDRVLARQGEKKIEIESSAGNPFTKGTARIDTNFKVGDSYSYREIDLYTKLEMRTFTNRVTKVTDTEVLFNDGRVVTDLFGNFVATGNGYRYTGAQFYIGEYSVGKKWGTRYRLTRPDGATRDSDYEFKVVTREKVTVPAGTFDAYRVEGQGWSTVFVGGSGSLNEQTRYWIAPGIKRAVAIETLRKHSSGKVLNNERVELTAYTQG